MAREARRIIDWIDTLATPADGTEQQRKKGPTRKWQILLSSPS